ncbi:5-dehydro-2-deoxygluconokinase [Pseudactinotalea terrae]|uniref:5-dehydro-2-deoxygluconokinase n=1 Tax=Pseudactinotalea terrae TaxID=1743262 RepID=UPI0012E123B5|nr:5-dehydro-2-deoxygluconokinase [Pseudactinotalea terrae]
MSHPAAGLDVLTMGRSGVDLYPLQIDVGLEDVTSFGKFLGGSPTNVAVAAARHGRSAAVVTGVGDDPFGIYVRRQMRELGVDDSLVVVDPILHTPITFCEIHPPDDFPLWFYREPSAPDLQITAEHVRAHAEAVTAASLFWMTVTGLSVEPSRAAHHAALEIRGKRTHTVLDLDYRPTLWADERTARAAVGEILGDVTVAVGNREECAMAIGETEPERAAAALLEAGVELAIVKMGPRGVLAATADEQVVVEASRVEVLNGLGAGDGFGGALCHGLLSGWDLHRMISFASAAGAIVASRLECSTAMPTTTEVEQLMTGADV